jgi:multicomponent Na+:H+ antiporter subunit G
MLIPLLSRGVLAAGDAVGAVVAETSVARFDGNILAEALILFGCVFILVSALGVLRFPDAYTRLHASTKLVSVAGIGIFGGAALAFSPVEATGRVLLIALFFFLTAPLSGYMIARAAYLRGIKPHWEEGSIDEWGEGGSALAPVRKAAANGEDDTTGSAEVL